ncbi:hypothetical protein SNE35_31360 [Paucibacter sp. R3-3]|uniref:Uncharacterized protein n=1 Tax=Roseateles agri TaxID=3098619 RepID=A0ABU5DUE5_9BURK|nr:hypothetical protein [Paucibacter sp. R3-3]MDY0749037.1 hypothetical protein [Paucibacter sp. R3-3]
MFGLANLGVIHTIFSMIALMAGTVCVLLDREIDPGTPAGRTFIRTTALTCVTALGAFRHGSFGKSHVLALATLCVLGIASLAGNKRMFGKAAPYVAAVSYSLSFFLHLVPRLAETFTCIPIGAPLFASAEDPLLRKTVGALFVLFLVCVAMQLRRLHFELH